MKQQIILILGLLFSNIVWGQTDCYNNAVPTIRQYYQKGELSNAKQYIADMEELCEGTPTYAFKQLKGEVYGNQNTEESPSPIVETVPVFPGCSGSQKEKKACLSRKIAKHVGKYFNSHLINELGLSQGKKRILVSFTINQEGNVVDVTAEAPHPALEEEAIRIMKMIPKVQPATQQGKPVAIKYTLPLGIENH